MVAILGSWNFPIATLLGPLVSAIAAGNAVIAKPSEISAFSAKVIKSLFMRHLDLNVYQCVNGGIKTAISLTSSKVDLIIYTGSTEKGRLVAAAAAQNLTPCILELGGKSPIIVDEGCNLDYTVSKVAAIANLNFGQLCIRCDYVLIPHTIADKFCESLTRKIDKMYAKGTDRQSLGKAISGFH